MNAFSHTVASLWDYASHDYSQRLLRAHAEREKRDLFARLKAIYLEDCPHATAEEFAEYTRLLAEELRMEVRG